MKRNTRRRWIGLLSLGLIAVAAIVVVLLAPWQSYSTGTVFAGTNDDRFTATAYSDVVRFQADGVATLQVRIFDLSGRELWGSGVVSGWSVDWDRRNDTGERLAYGAYIYSAQGWNTSGDLNFQKNGKLVLLPGDKVQLQQAPTGASKFVEVVTPGSSDEQVRALAGGTPCVCNDFSGANKDVYVAGKLGIGTTGPSTKLHLKGSAANDAKMTIEASARNDPSINFRSNTGQKGVIGWYHGHDAVKVLYGTGLAGNTGIAIKPSGNVGIGTAAPSTKLHLKGSAANDAKMTIEASAGNDPSINFKSNTGQKGVIGWYHGHDAVKVLYGTGLAGKTGITIKPSGNVGIGTSSPNATLDIHGSASDLLSLSATGASGNPKFRVTNTGDVRADGSYYCGAGAPGCYQSGNADVAERINTSEWVEMGNVVEIDPEHPGFFRKTHSPYSTNVAGIISTSPGVVLGNNFDAKADKWEDNRPMLALAGRVPVKASTENGPIQIGDLLVSSSVPGVAMKGDPAAAIGAVVGKAMEPLENGSGTIMVQVMLR